MTEQMPSLNLIQRAMQFSIPDGAGLRSGVGAAHHAENPGTVPPIEPAAFRSVDSEIAFDGPLSAGREVAFNPGQCREGKILLPGMEDMELRNEFRAIKRRLLLSLNKTTQEHHEPNVVLVTSARPAEGKTFVSLNLALSLADEHDLQILLMEGDVVNPSLSRYFASGRTRDGLTELLNERRSAPDDVIHPCEGVANLSVMFAGNPCPRSSELMASSRMPELLAQLHRSRRNLLVIIDCSPMIAPEPAALAGHVSHTIVVVGAEQASQDELQDAIHQLAPCRDVSLVFNKSPRWRKKGGYYGYGYRAEPSGGARPDLGAD